VEIVSELRGSPRRGVKKEAGELVGDSKQRKEGQESIENETDALDASKVES
jgi:hypothetical protein